ncbi:hypothetical protein PUNSTDRAFT_139325 [Punctularia strigosozonata HHB-11173 SS5]|uniref:Cytochrome b mRNA-processing protein 4 n=1 Tax=Punctularia strigosozonata (strain HHB-11173) TaxID=741275 RepID=R7S1E1_PUNST|nr:uncharacterized protein PUNSTDRAFT_139325 [Punctularia strigosozonata HHB-11173 SS5]EIN03602.1 hypothetical protein PUNSTDRAFT_139325 [Punctularia strigosozonata HHB-11173 SS5]
MSAGAAWGKLALATVGIMGLGYGLMVSTVPTPEQTYQAMSPDLRRKVDAARAARLAQEDATKRQLTAQAPDTKDADKPLWADSPPQIKARS